jgi:glycyl-tRNA synthetase alpha chain
MYLESLGALGIDIRHHDIRFEEDNWEAPTLGAWGMGWQVMLDGLEITQFTYFQQSGGVDLEPISVELTYGLERSAAFLQNVEDVYQVRWNETVTYGDMRRPEELELSVYDFEAADPETCRKLLDLYEGEASRLLGEYLRDLGARGSEEAKFENRNSKIAPSFDFRVSDPELLDSSNAHPAAQQSHTGNTSSFTLNKERFPLRKVYDLTLKCSHLFNILDARGAISVTERVALIARVRKLACEVAAIHLDRQAEVAA